MVSCMPWPSYVAYATVFLTIGLIWVNHHTVLQQIGRVDRTFLFINVVLPDDRRVQSVSDPGGRRAPPGGVKVRCVRLRDRLHADGDLLWRHVVLRGAWSPAIAEDADQRVVSGISRSFAPGSLIYGAATLSSLISAYLAVALYAAIALFYVVESSVFGRSATTYPT